MLLDNLTRIFGKSNPWVDMFVMKVDGSGGGADEEPMPGATPPEPPAGEPQDTFSWKSHLGPDLSNAPMFQKFEDNKDGLTNAFKSHVELEKLLGHEKVPIPKGDNDEAGWNQYMKAMGIPNEAGQYGLSDVELPEAMKGVSFDKQKFSEIVHGFKLTPNQAKGLWGAYTEQVMSAYQQHMKTLEEDLNTNISRLKSEWGDSYDGKVELGQTVINKFATDQETQDWLTSTMVKDPRGIKFLAKIGEQFSENKIGEFKYQGFSLTPEAAGAEYEGILNDPSHPYNNEKADPAARNRAIDYVNKLIAIKAGAQG